MQYTSGGPVLRNVNFGVQARSLICVSTSATFLKMYLIIFTVKIQPCFLIIYICMYRKNHILLTSKSRRAPLLDVDRTGSRGVYLCFLENRGDDTEPTFSKRSTAFAATLLKGCDFWRFVWSAKLRSGLVSYPGYRR